MSSTKKMTTSALMIALATALAWVSKVIPAPWMQGGSITIASMVPIIAVSIMLGTKWGLASSLVYALIQMIQGFYPPPTRNFISYLLVIALDYIIAFGVLGLAGLFYRLFGKTRFAAAAAAFIVTALRYVCHILSGILIWGVYADEGQSVLAYSLTYNGTYMIPEIIISTVVVFVLGKFICEKTE